jgi:hypothetical protein
VVLTNIEEMEKESAVLRKKELMAGGSPDVGEAGCR